MAGGGWLPAYVCGWDCNRRSSDHWEDSRRAGLLARILFPLWSTNYCQNTKDSPSCGHTACPLLSWTFILLLHPMWCLHPDWFDRQDKTHVPLALMLHVVFALQMFCSIEASSGKIKKWSHLREKKRINSNVSVELTSCTNQSPQSSPTNRSPKRSSC